MIVNVIEISKEKSVLEVKKGDWASTLEIVRRGPGHHAYDDFAEWPINDDEYYELEEVVDQVIEKMEGKRNIEVNW